MIILRPTFPSYRTMKSVSLQKIYRRAKQVTKYVKAVNNVAAFKEHQHFHKIQMGVKNNI